MIDIESLHTIEPDLRPIITSLHRDDVGSLAYRIAQTGLTVRVSRGRKMRRLAGLFDELAASRQFPLWFGETWDALDECFSDLEGLPTGKGIALVWTEAEEILADEPEKDLAVLLSVMRNAASTWAEPIALGEWWDRPAVPFHVILNADSRNDDLARARWIAAGADLCTPRAPGD